MVQVNNQNCVSRVPQDINHFLFAISNKIVRCNLIHDTAVLCVTHYTQQSYQPENTLLNKIQCYIFCIVFTIFVRYLHELGIQSCWHSQPAQYILIRTNTTILSFCYLISFSIFFPRIDEKNNERSISLCCVLCRCQHSHKPTHTRTDAVVVHLI